MQALRKAADDRGMLLIFDEAQTAFGRIGWRTGSEFFGVVPDIMTVSKTMGGGLPLAAAITSPAIEQRVHERGFTFYTSHVSDPLPATVGLAVLATIQQERLIERARTTGAYLRQQLRELQQRYEVIGDVRGEGMLLGVELVKDRGTKEPDPQGTTRLMEAARKRGLLIGKGGLYGNALRIAPPMVVARSQIDDALRTLGEALAEALR